MLYFLYCLSKALATPRKKPNGPHRGRDPQIENHWFGGFILMIRDSCQSLEIANDIHFVLTLNHPSNIDYQLLQQI